MEIIEATPLFQLAMNSTFEVVKGGKETIGSESTPCFLTKPRPESGPNDNAIVLVLP